MKTRSTFAEKFRQPIFRNLLFAFGITLLGVFSLFSYYRIRAMVGSSNMVNHTNLVILKIEQALSIVKDAETGQRGFIITNDSVFFQPAIGADDHAMKVLAELKLLITDDETQTENLHRYKALILSRINHLKISREYRNTPGYDPNILKSHLLEGKRSMDSVRSQAAMMEQVEQKLLSQRIGRNEQNIIFTPIFSLIVSALLLTIIIISFYKLRHRYNEQKKVKERLQESNAELNEAHGELKASEEKFKGLLESAPDAMVIVNEEGIIELVNAQSEKLFGYTRQDLIGRQIGFLIPYRFSSKHPGYRKNYFNNPKTRLMGEGRELFAKKSDGEEIPVEISLSPLQTPHGLLVSAAIRDVSEKKKNQKAIIESEKLMAVAALSKTIAHEIRNPLTNISLSAEILQEKLAPSKDFAELEPPLNIILRNYKRIDQLVKDLLYSDKTGEKNFVKINLAEIVEDVLATASDRILLKGISVEKNYGRDYSILADGEGLKIALVNIIINAVEAMQAHTGSLQISIVRQAEAIMLTVRDNGIGMTQEEVAKMFEPYYSGKSSGLGIGLANVKSILQSHNAMTEVNSEPGKGTTFTIFFNEN